MVELMIQLKILHTLNVSLGSTAVCVSVSVLQLVTLKAKRSTRLFQSHSFHLDAFVANFKVDAIARLFQWPVMIGLEFPINMTSRKIIFYVKTSIRFFQIFLNILAVFSFSHFLFFYLIYFFFLFLFFLFFFLFFLFKILFTSFILQVLFFFFFFLPNCYFILSYIFFLVFSFFHLFIFFLIIYLFPISSFVNIFRLFSDPSTFSYSLTIYFGHILLFLSFLMLPFFALFPPYHFLLFTVLSCLPYPL